MYYHGVTNDVNRPNGQCSFVSFSKNGLDFNSNSGILGMFYFRVFKYKNKFCFKSNLLQHKSII